MLCTIIIVHLNIESNAAFGRIKDMNLEVGKKYKTRNSGSVVIDREEKSEPLHPFFGKIKDDNGDLIRIAFYTSGGRYQLHKESDFDIVEEIN